MKEKQMLAFRQEIQKAKSLIAQADLEQAFLHLERAHVLGQRFVLPHTLAHFYMLKIGWLRKDVNEVIGQIIRLPLGVIGSAIGVVPTGNTGGSNVSAFQKMEIPADIQELMK